MLGGGNFAAQNKVLPGAYINFVSAAGTTALLSERGVAAVPMVLGWGLEQQIFEVTASDFQERCQEIFGYPTEAPELWQVRELFKNLTKRIFYRLNVGDTEANKAYYCLHKLHKWPHEYLELDTQEQIKLGNDKKAAKQAKRSKKR